MLHRRAHPATRSASTLARRQCVVFYHKPIPLSGQPQASPHALQSGPRGIASASHKAVRARRCTRGAPVKASDHSSSGPSRDPPDGFVEVKVDQVRMTSGQAVVYLRVLDGRDRVLAVHIGENESSALLKEINKQRQMRPLTHDLVKNVLREINYRVVKIRITDIVSNTYYARVHLARFNAVTGQPDPDSEVDVDARPSDAINLAVRFGSPMYVSRRIADSAAQPYPEQQELKGAAGAVVVTGGGESASEIVRSVREAIASYEDPTMMYQLHLELAAKGERYEEARQMQQKIIHEMTHNQLLRLVVAMESALGDGRYEEAARLRDEFKKLSANAPSEQRRS